MATGIISTDRAIGDPSPRAWTRDEYFRLAEQGFFDGQRVELIEGEIVVMSPQGPDHFACVHLVVYAIQAAIGAEFWVRSQGPLPVSIKSVPEPDIAVVPGTPRDYRKHPSTALLAVEVSDSTRSFDLRRKAKLYAASQGIPECWVVDLVDRVLYVMLDPQQGEYKNIVKYDLAAVIKPSALPGQPIKVADLFP